jgi:hypothetical protein
MANVVTMIRPWRLGEGCRSVDRIDGVMSRFLLKNLGSHFQMLSLCVLGVQFKVGADSCLA